jgi:hypothetical protein
MSEADYRRGYQHGANAVLDVVDKILTPEQRQKLNDWADGPLTDWRDDELRDPQGAVVIPPILPQV